MKQPYLGQRICELRKAEGLTQKELAQNCRISLRTLQRVETGAVNPRSYTLKMIGEILDYNFYSPTKPKGDFIFNGKMINKAADEFMQLLNLKTNTMKKLSILSIIACITVGSFFIFSTTSKAQEYDFEKFSKTNHKGVLIFFPMGVPIRVRNMKDTADFKFGDNFIQEFENKFFLNRTYLGKAFPGDSVILCGDTLSIKSSYWIFTTSSSYGIKYLIPEGTPIKNTRGTDETISIYIEDNIIKEEDSKIYLDGEYIGEAYFGDSVIYNKGILTIIN